MHTTLHHHIAFRRLTAGARLVFYVCLEIAGDVEQDGALSVKGAGPMTVAEIATEVGVTEAQTKKGLDDLVRIGFVSINADGAYAIEKFSEKAGEDSSTPRTRAWREREKKRSRNVPGDGHGERSGDGVEKEVEIDTPYGVAAPGFPIAETETPERLADPYLETFVNCKSAKAKGTHRATIVGQLREMHSDGHTWSSIFAAAQQAYSDGNGAPLRRTTPVWSILRAGRKPLAAVKPDHKPVPGPNPAALR